MQITVTLKPGDRAEWRAWLEQNHRQATEIWLLFDDRPDVPGVSYLDAVEEALCFGWIDGIQKRASENERALRFSPRRRGGNWTELNKERVRRLIRLGQMTEAGLAALPDMAIPADQVADDIAAALKAEPGAWENFLAFPELYRRIRLAYLEEVRMFPGEFERRLSNFVRKTTANRMFGNWNDGGRLD